MNVWFIPQGLLTAAFLRAVLTGVLSGAVYDLSRAPRRAFGIRRVISALLDAGFVLVLLTGIMLILLLSRVESICIYYAEKPPVEAIPEKSIKHAMKVFFSPTFILLSVIFIVFSIIT